MTPTVGSLPDGRFMVTWTDALNFGAVQDIRGRIFNADGTAVGDGFIVNTTTPGAQRDSEVTGLADGRFLVTWEDAYDGGGLKAFRGRIFNADGTPFDPDGQGPATGDDFLIGAMMPPTGSIITGSSAITALPNGGFVVVLGHTDGRSLDSYDIWARIFNPDGTAAGDFLVNTTPGESPSVAALPDGRFMVAYSGIHVGVIARIFNPDGTPYSAGEFNINSPSARVIQFLSVAASPNGRFVVTWSDYGEGGDGSGSAIRGRILEGLPDLLSVEAGADVWAVEGQPVNLAAWFTNPDPTDTHTATIDWGDGTVEPGTIASGPIGQVIGSHAYADNGSYWVTVTVSDDDGTSASDFHAATISNAAPTVDAVADAVVVKRGSPVRINATVTDPGAADTHTAVINWGDFTTEEVAVVGGQITASHVYSPDDLGIFFVTVEVRDDDGAIASDAVMITLRPDNKNIAVFDDPSYAEDASIAAILSARGHSASLFAGTTAAALSAALAGKSVLVLPSLEQSTDVSWQGFDAAAQEVLRLFVSRGGTLVFSGDNEGRGMGIVNSIFGLSLGNAYAAPLTFPLAPGSDNSVYDVGDTLVHTYIDENGVFFGQVHELQTDTLPLGSTLLYGTEPVPGVSSGLTAAALMPFGGGAIAYLGWDEFNRSFPGAGAWDDLLIRIVENSAVVQNSAPVAANDIYATAEDAALTIAAPGVFANDSDSDGDALVATLLTGPAHGTLALGPNGGFTYTPNGDFSGLDSFTYRATDSGGLSATATVELTVNPVNDAPVANPDSYSVDEDNVLLITAPGLLGNDIDADGDRLDSLMVSAPLNGSLVTFLDGSFRYQPNPNFYGTDTFTYKAKELASGGLESNLATVTITVNPVNDAPVLASALADQSSAEDTAWSFTVPTGTFTDVENATLQYTATLGDGTPSPLWLGFNPATQTFSGTPPLNFNGDIVLKVMASDGALSTSDTFTLAVTPVNDAPVLTGRLEDQISPEDAPWSLTVPAGTFTDVDDATLQYAATLGDGTPLPTWLTFDFATRTFSGTPPQNFNGQIALKVTASDGAASASATFTLAITPVNDAPVAVNDSYHTRPNTELVIPPAAGLLANDVDADGDALALGLITGPTHGLLRLLQGGAFQYVPDLDYTGPDNFTYWLGDGTTQSNIATVTLMVGNGTGQAPVAANDSYTIGEDTRLRTSSATGILANDSDAEGDPLAITLVSGPVHGSLRLLDGGAFDYTPDADYNGPDSFTYRVNDGRSQSNLATVNLTVTAVNDRPVPRNDVYETSQGTPLVVPGSAGVLANDHDADGDALSAALVGGVPRHGALAFNPDGSFVYTPAPGYVGPDRFTYEISDGSGAAPRRATVFLTVNAGRAPIALPDTAAVSEDGFVSIDVLRNDLDPDVFDTLSIVSVSPSEKGAGVLVAPGGQRVLYSANADVFDLLLPGETTTDTFTYSMRDRAGNESSALVTVTVRGDTNNGTLTGTPLNETLYGDTALQIGDFRLPSPEKEDVITGLGGDDRVFGLTGADRLFGGDGDDLLVGGPGMDTLFGDNGNDVLQGGGGNDWLEGGAGDDTLSGDGHTRSRYDNFFAGAEGPTLPQGQGDDTLIDDAGNEVMTGGGGADTFVIRPGIRQERDRITDFEVGVDHLVFGPGVQVAALIEGDVDGDRVLDTVLDLGSDGLIEILKVNGLTSWQDLL